jgi:hypothetical protein
MRKGLRNKLKSLSDEYKDQVYIEKKSDVIVVYFINDKIAGQRVKEEVEDFLGTVIETIHRYYPYNLNEKDLFLAVTNGIERVVEK